MSDEPGIPDTPGYPMGLANASYHWYKAAAIRSRRAYKVSETLFLLLSASIPVSAVVWQHSAVVPAFLGSACVVLAGLRTIFHWQDNYVRFSGAREAIEAERRLYHTNSSPYDSPDTRDALLAKAVSRIEQAEMGGWLKIVIERPNEREGVDGSA